ncbi:hypothetical protein EJB05_05844, partial [Eragrostis curvula]
MPARVRQCCGPPPSSSPPGGPTWTGTPSAEMAEEITEVVKAINNIAAAIRETVNEEMHLEPYGVNEEKSIKDQGEIQAIACMSQAGKKRKMSVPPAIQERSWFLRRTAPPSRNMTGSDVHTLIGAVGMGDHEARGDDLEKKADKKLSGWGLFGNKYSDAANLLDNAGNFFKLAKNWSRAAAVYKKLAYCRMQGESYYKSYAAPAYVEAANCYKRFSPHDAAEAFNNAVNLYMETGNLGLAARYSEYIGEIYQQEQDLENAAVYLNQAADLFDSEGQSPQANTMTQKIAEIYAQLEKYQEATQLFEEIARKSMNDNNRKYHVKGNLLNAGICQLCRGDPVTINNSLERYEDIDPTFSGTREYKLLADLAASMDGSDVAKFTDAIKNLHRSVANNSPSQGKE